jgi:hypothetical protein
MDTNLRPLTLGEILDRTAQLYRTNFLLFLGISAIYAGAVLALGLGQIGVQELMKTPNPHVLLAVLNAVLLVMQIALLFILSGVEVAANNRAVAWLHLGQPASVREAYASVLPKAGRIIWLMLIVTFLAGWPMVLIYAGFVGALLKWAPPLGKGAMAAGAHPDLQQTMMLAAVSLIFLALLGLAMVYAVMMGLRYSLAVPACVVEDLKARKAIKRSIELSKGARGRVFLLGLLVFIIAMGLTLLAQAFFFVAIFKHHGVLPAWMRALQQVVSFATTTFIGPMYATGLTLFYYDQRVRKEGFDIEWMMQAAGMAPGELPAAAPEAGPAAETAPVESPIDVPMEAPVEAVALPGTEADAHAGSAHE